MKINTLKRLGLLFFFTVILCRSVFALPPEQKLQHVNNSDRTFICDLDYGTLGELKVGDVFEYDKLLEYIGQQPDKDIKGTFSSDGLKYYKKGLEIYYIKTESSGKFQILQILIFLTDYNFDGELFKKFSGLIVPSVEGNYRKDEINKLFGKPSRLISSPIFDPETEEYYYDKDWGTLLFVFRKNSNLLYIALQYKRWT